jgi:hypothetical protein
MFCTMKAAMQGASRARNPMTGANKIQSGQFLRDAALATCSLTPKENTNAVITNEQID